MAKKGTSQTRQAGRVTDARGRSVTQLDPVMMHLLHQPGVIPPDVLRQMSRRIGIGMTRANRLAIGGSVVCLLCFAIALAISITRLADGSIGMGKAVRNLVPYLGIWVAPMSLWIGTRNVRHQRIAKVMLEHLRCPHCGYDIRGLPRVPEDGATVCPECGCAWRLGDSPNVAGHGDGVSGRACPGRPDGTNETDND